MKVQDVILRAMAKRSTWWMAAVEQSDRPRLMRVTADRLGWLIRPPMFDLSEVGLAAEVPYPAHACAPAPGT